MMIGAQVALENLTRHDIYCGVLHLWQVILDVCMSNANIIAFEFGDMGV